MDIVGENPPEDYNQADEGNHEGEEDLDQYYEEN